jgi:hypothetical protein
MASSELSNEARPSVNQSAARQYELKPYRAPTLVKRTILSAITADTAVSGGVAITG